MAIEDDDTLSSGCETIGADHRQMVELIAALGSCIRERRGRDAICDAARELSRCSAAHFDREKRLMALSGFPEADAHLWQHRELLDQLTMLIHSMEGAGADISAYTIDFVDHWFADHVRTSDSRLADFLSGFRGTLGPS